MVTLMEAVFLGAVQGLTEWLPISSSAHLVILQQTMGIDVPLMFDVLLHLGSVIAVIAFFRRELWKALHAVLRWDIYAGGRMAVYVAAATVPVALAGVFFYDVIAAAFGSLYFVGFLLIFTGFILFNTRFVDGDRKLDGVDAMIVGLAQAMALMPGISRSGITISAALMRKVRKEQAFAFSFMLAIPAILGASAFELYRAGPAGYAFAFTPEMMAGAAVAAVVGYASLDFLRRFVMESRFYKFAFYCWALGIIVLAYNFLTTYSIL